jgi:hypothetical protein
VHSSAATKPDTPPICIQVDSLAAIDRLLTCLVADAAGEIRHAQAAERVDWIVVAHDFVQPWSCEMSPRPKLRRRLSRYQDSRSVLCAHGTENKQTCLFNEVSETA